MLMMRESEEKADLASGFSAHFTRQYSFSTQSRSRLIAFMTKGIVGLLIVSLAITMTLAVLFERILTWSDLHFVLFVAMLGLAIVIAGALCTWGCVANSHLMVTSDGLDFRLWPGYHLTCQWSDVRALVRADGEGSNDLLILSESTLCSHSLLFRLHRAVWLANRSCAIPLSLLDGWPRGDLLEDLYWYAPHLFKGTLPTRPGSSNGQRT
jgi:hypothetical protein